MIMKDGVLMLEDNSGKRFKCNSGMPFKYIPKIFLRTDEERLALLSGDYNTPRGLVDYIPRTRDINETKEEPITVRTVK